MRIGIRSLLGSLLLAALVAERALAQVCPSDVVKLGRSSQPTASHSTSVLDTSHVACHPLETNPPPTCPPLFSGRLSYDWRNGSFSASASAQFFGNGSSSVWAEDEFVVHGLAAPTTVTAVLTVNGAAGGEHHMEGSAFGLVEARLASHGGDPAHQAEYVFGQPSTPIQLVLRSSFSVNPGQPVRIRLLLNTGAFLTNFAYSSSASAVATLTFEGIPSGAVIRSCKGYGDFVTRTKRGTWGALKASYRR